MRFLSRAPLVLALLYTVFAGAPLPAQTPRPVPEVRVLRGRILDAVTRAEVRNASVSVAGRARGIESDDHGRFVFTGLPAAVAAVEVRAIGYDPVSVSIDLGTADREIQVSLQPRTVALDSIVGRSGGTETVLREDRSTVRLDEADLARMRGQTLGETLKEVPGVVVIQYGPSIAKPVVRGLHSQRIVVMNGAVPQEGQQWGAEHAPEIDVFAANDVEVIRGAAGILYGSNAIGGVVRVLPRPLPTEHGVSGELQTNLFSNNRQGAFSLRLEGGGLDLPLLPDLSWRLQGTLRRAGDARTSAYYLPNTAFSESDFNGAIGLRHGNLSSEISFSHFGTHLGMYTGAHIGNLDDLERAMRTPVVSDTFSSAIRRPDQEVTHDLLAWRNELTVGNTGKLEVNYGYQYNDRNEYDSRGFAATNPRPAFGLRLITHTIDARFHHALSSRIAGTVGVVGLRQGNLSPGRSFLIPQYRLYSGGIFGLEQWTDRHWTIGAGVRYDTRWQHAYQYGAPVVVSPDDVSSDQGITASLSVGYLLTANWSVTATTGRMWRAPNVNERFSQGVHHGTAQYEIGDASLGQERTIPLDATLRFVGVRTRLELSAYSNRIDGYIFLRPREPIQTVRGAYPAYSYTATDARMQGAEISVQYDPSARLSLYASGTLVRGTDRTTDTPLFDMPADRVIGTIRYTAPTVHGIEGLYLEAGPTLVRRQDHVPSTTIYRLPTDGYALIGIEAGASRLTLLGHSFELGLSVRNLFDTSYRDYLSRYRLFVDDTGRDLVFRLRTGFGRGT